MYKKYQVELTPDQRQHLKELVSTGTLPNAAHTHARILLKADAAPGGPAWKDAQISDAFDVSIRTVVRVRHTFLQGGLARAVPRQRPRTRYHRLVDGSVEAHLVALVCSPPPDGHARWTLRLVSDKLVELVEIESISYETVRRVLKKTNLSLG